MMDRLVTGLIVVACLWTGKGAWLFRKHSSGLQSASAPKEDSCIEKAKSGDCEFYTCFDKRHQCQFHNNYALNYGQRICHRFNERRARFSEKAWTWINNTRICEMKKLLPSYEADTIDCLEHFTKHAYGFDCYWANWLCDVDMLWRHRHILTDVYKPSPLAEFRFLMGMNSCHARRLRHWVVISIARTLPLLN